MVPIITVDGPSGAGKGAVCKSLAEFLHWNLLDSGLLYRILAFQLISKNIDLNQKDTIIFFAKNLDVCFKSIEGKEIISVFLNNQDVTDELRSEEVAFSASNIARVSEVREALLEKQRNFAELPGLVADGRDMGTVVFSDAPLKIFLTASVEVRAKRRYKQLMNMGQNVNLAHLIEVIEARDNLDAGRSASPLKPAIDAVTIDSSSLTIDQVFELILDLARNRDLIK